jgi:hypothetical protein
MTRLLFLFVMISQVTFGQEKLSKQPLLADSTVNLYAFVGEKISVVEFDPNKDGDPDAPNKVDTITGDTIGKRSFFIMDRHFYATYKVVHNVFNELKGDSIRFKAFDRYGRPAFELHPTVLLYISKSGDGKSFFHQKGQFDELVKNANGQWVGKNGESLEQLFNVKRKTVFKERGLFK